MAIKLPDLRNSSRLRKLRKLSPLKPIVMEIIFDFAKQRSYVSCLNHLNKCSDKTIASHPIGHFDHQKKKTTNARTCRGLIGKLHLQ